MSFIKEFKEFAVKGNVIDLAVGVIIGTAFGKIVSSLVTDIIMPPFSYLTGGIDFETKTWILKEGVGTTTHIALNYGTFFSTVLDFLIISFAIFFAVRTINRLKRHAPPEINTKECPFCKTNIHKDATRCSSCTSTLL